jgi:hypothetical protein
VNNVPAYQWTNKPNRDCQVINTPIVIDLNGNGIKLTSPEGGVAFDLNANGQREFTSWTQGNGDNAFLVLDRNGDGAITNGAELFGDSTAQPATWNPNGFLALKVFDANGDGVISASDPAYMELRLWNDIDHDGRSAPGEMSTLTERGVKSISTDFKTSEKTDRYHNAFRYRAKVEGLKGQPFANDVILKATAPPSR